ncbi:PREDICTED: monocarboxylate transporter 12 [Nicrophorus vespilloides]|uniref:Monocarboxylate transporter 12 n=1 Tax=Nicrophorus vespilloides TaxID=110193 RepID=A0ABM1MDI6_NICVS|nr:PREDICTED: monocarboxylate transporter 12 [Nicrophorus vespilloides]
MANYRKEPPDGGWGWIIVIGVALTNMVNQSLVSLFGLLFGEEIEAMGHGTMGVALVMNICSMVTNFSGIVTGPLLKNYSPRLVTFIGVLLTSTGLILSSFATNLAHLIITYSLFTGLGFGLIMPATFLAVKTYFDKKRSQAVGLSMAGTGIGQMLMPQLVRYLLDEYGYKGATFILGALSLHGLVGSLLFQPVQWHEKKVEVDETTSLLSAAPSIAKKPDSVVEVPSKSKSQLENAEISTCVRIWKKICQILDLDLLLDGVFINIIIGLAVVYTASISFSMLFPFYLQEARGLSRSETALSMSLLSAADIVARLSIPYLASKCGMGNRMTFLVGGLMLAICRSLVAMQTTLETVLVASVICGYVRAATVINQNLTVSEYCTNEKKLPAALGLNMVAKGIFVLTVGQLFGFIRDYTNSYSICIHVQSSCMIVVMVIWAVEMMVKRSRLDV